MHPRPPAHVQSRPLRLRSIRSRMMVAFMLLVLLPAVTVSISSAVMGYRSGKQQVFDQLDSVLTLKEAEIRTWVEGLRSDLAFAASGGETRGWIEELISSARKDSAQQRGERLSFEYAYLMLRERFLRITELANRPRLRELFLLSREGDVLLSTDAWNEHLNLSFQDFFIQGQRRPGVHIERLPNAAAKDEVWAVLVVEPFFDQNGEVLGLLAGRADISRLNAIMSQRSGLGKTGETFLLAPPAILLTESRFRGYLPGQARLNEYRRLFAQQSDSGDGMYADYRGEPVIGAHKRLDDLQLLLVAEMDQAEAFQSIYTALKLDMAVALASVLLAVFASAVYTRGLASRLGSLAATAKAVAAGDLGRSAPVTGEEEISSLAAAFNAMTDRLHRRIESENLVADVSRALLPISPANTDELVFGVLDKVARHLGVDRMEVFKLDEEAQHVDAVHEWQDEGLSPRGEAVRNLEVKAFAWFVQQVMDAGILHVPRMAALPPEAGREREFWTSLGIKSLAVAPLVPGGELRGFLAAETVWGERRFTKDELALLTLLADIVGSALQRVATLQALQHSEERYALAQRAASIGSWEWDVSSGKLYCSDAFEPILGFGPGGFDGRFRTFLRMVHPEDKPAVLDAIRQTLQQGRSYAAEHRVVRNDGVVRWISEAGAIHRSEEGRPRRMLGIVRDITERKQAEEDLAAMNRRLEQLVEERTRALEQKARELEAANERLLELDKLKSAFLASVSHELRTPLTSILGFAKLIRRDLEKHFDSRPGGQPREATRAQGNLDIILLECERLTRLINDVLDLTKIESGRVDWRDRTVDVAACIRTAVEAVRVQFEAKPGIALKLDLPKQLPPLFMDPDRLCQVLMNLLNNAVKFTQQGEVRLVAREAGEGVLRIEVQDTGVGIESADLEKVFDKFHQATQDDTLQNKPQGTGLGLAICRQIVENYKGRIWVRSTPGEGSTFIVELPVSPVAVEDAQAGG